MRVRFPFRRIGVAEAQDLLERGDLAVFDTRDIGAYAAGCLAGAMRLSTATLSAAVAETPKDRPVLIYCYHGNASQDYAQIFSDFGFLEVYSLDGGFEAWRGGVMQP